MGGDNSTTTGSANPNITAATDTIGKELNNQLTRGVQPFGQSMYPGMSSQTRAGATNLFTNPGTSGYVNDMTKTMGQFGAIASGQNISDPTNDLVRKRLMDSVATNVNSAGLTDGRFGSSAHLTDMADMTASALAPHDYGRQITAAGMMPQLWDASNRPAMSQLQAGQIFDADALASRQGDAALWDAMQNQGWNTLGRASQILAGTAPSGGTTTTQQTPWWMAPAQIGGTILGAMI